jgi:hypothetical protein
MSTIIIIFMAIVLCFCMIITKNMEFINNPNNGQFISALGSISNMLMAITSVLNISIIIHFYYADKKRQKEAEKTNNRIYWFRTLIIEKNFDRIEKFFNSNINIIGILVEICGEKATLLASDYETKIQQEVYGAYNNELTLINQYFIDLISSSNPLFGNRIQKLFENFQDEFTIEMEKYSLGKIQDSLTLHEIVSNQKKILLIELYNYGYNNCKINTNKNNGEKTSEKLF